MDPAAPPAAGDRVAISARQVTHRFGKAAAVTGLNLDVPAGSIFGFIGPSGAGKTTTIRVLTGIQAPTEGEVRVLGRSPSRFTPAERARIGYLPQLSVLFPTLSLEGNLSFVASIYGMPRRRRRRLREALEFVELWDDRRKRLRDASGGMQRRLALAASLVHDPELLFLDEPTAGIDPVLRRKFWDRFGHLRDSGRTLFVTTQYVGDAAYCDLVGVLDHGRVVALDTPDGLRRKAFGGDLLAVQSTYPVEPAAVAELCRLPFVTGCDVTEADRTGLRLVVDRAEAAIPRVTSWFEQRGTPLESIHPDRPPFDDVFVALVQDGGP